LHCVHSLIGPKRILIAIGHTDELPACCNDPKCKTYQGMSLKMRVYGMSTTPQREGNRSYFDAPIPDFWTKRRLEAFAEVVRGWRKGH